MRGVWARMATPVRVVGLAMILLAIPAAHASASSQQISIMQDDPRLDADPAGTLARMRLLGADAVRVSVYWASIAPAPAAKRPPRGFNAADPAAYPARNWRLWDEIVTVAHRDGIRVDLDLMGGAPRWANGPGRPAGSRNANWEPSASAYGSFVRAIGLRYSGNYNPSHRALTPGDPDDLPRVDFWTIWNEPDYGPSLAPQGLPSNLKIENSPRMYRNLVNAAWSGLQSSGHNPSNDTIAFGELAPRGESFWGVFSGMKPLTFLRALYCVDAGYHPLRGTAAQLRGCPTNAAGSRRFRAQNPALFRASGVSDHPYMRWYAPGHEQNPDPVNHSSTGEYSSLGVIGNLTRALDRLQQAYGSRTRFPVYDTEFGYITSPPKHSPDPTTRVRVIYLSPTKAAEYMNWAEYISWRNSRLTTFEQYLLIDPLRPTRANDWGSFASGLVSWNGSEKATYDAWRLPLYLPITRAHRGRALEVWGCIRPARLAQLDSGLPQTAQLQFEPRGAAAYSTLRTIATGAGSNCYFDLPVTFPSSGTVRLAYSYPGGDALLGSGAAAFSRAVSVSVG